LYGAIETSEIGQAKRPQSCAGGVFEKLFDFRRAMQE
jgi:hypothetical protein